METRSCKHCGTPFRPGVLWENEDYCESCWVDRGLSKGRPSDEASPDSPLEDGPSRIVESASKVEPEIGGLAKEIEALQKLHQHGAMNDEEFAAAKARVIADGRVTPQQGSESPARAGGGRGAPRAVEVAPHSRVMIAIALLLVAILLVVLVPRATRWLQTRNARVKFAVECAERCEKNTRLAIEETVDNRRNFNQCKAAAQREGREYFCFGEGRDFEKIIKEKQEQLGRCGSACAQRAEALVEKE